MNLTFAIYLIGILDTVRAAFAISAVVIGVTTGLFILLWLTSESDGSTFPVSNPIKCIKRVIVSIGILVLLACSIPSSKTVAAMVIIPALVENKNIQELTGNGLEALNLLTKQWVESLTKGDAK